MPSKNLVANFTLAASAILLCAAGYLYYESGECGPCDDAKRYDAAMSNDGCVAIDKATAQRLFDLYKRSPEVHTPWGAWIGKELIDAIFDHNCFANGLFIILGKNESTGETCFILTGDSTSYRTRVEWDDTKNYFKLDAMCPPSCNGLDATK